MITINGLNHYQELSQRTANTHDYELANYGLGLAGEASEITSIALKGISTFEDVEVFKKELKKELGDVLWYTSQIARIAGLSLEELKIKVTLNNSFRNRVMRLNNKSGEMADLIKKHVFHGHSIEKELIKEILGAVLSWVVSIGKFIELEILDIATANIEKLMRRYPAGFSVERSINREE
jgi:NTP pyrophosphatase (non-canonical NTP hydrolase)